MPGPYQTIDCAKEYEAWKRYWSFEFELAEHTLSAKFQYSVQEHGVPKRRGFIKKMPIFRIGNGESVQFIINGKHIYRTGTFYTHNVVNFHFGEFNRAVFLNAKFKRLVDLQDTLF